MTARCLLLAIACGLLAPAPVLATPDVVAQLPFLGPDEETIADFEKAKAMLAAYEKGVAEPLSARKCRQLANELNSHLSEMQPSGRHCREHPDWNTIAPRAEAAMAWVNSANQTLIDHHPALGLKTPADIKLYEAIDQRAALNRADTPEQMVAAIARLSALSDKPAAKAMVEQYRRNEAVGKVNEALPEFLALVQEDHVRLARNDEPSARADGEALSRRVRCLLALGVKRSTLVTLSEDPLTPESATLDAILTTANLRAAGRPATDAVSKAARAVELKVEGVAAVSRAFQYEHTRGKPKAMAVFAEHGLPSFARSGPNGTEQWVYRYRREGIDRAKTLTLSSKDGSLLRIENRFE
ncbi:MAG: hypothetical protein VKP62_10960 [Candidatus Sericytochromatia bacterium]|nr:hypothetical protein [Candidatus Sericytochromatia bacterium]